MHSDFGFCISAGYDVDVGRRELIAFGCTLIDETAVGGVVGTGALPDAETVRPATLITSAFAATP